MLSLEVGNVIHFPRWICVVGSMVGFDGWLVGCSVVVQLLLSCCSVVAVLVKETVSELWVCLGVMRGFGPAAARARALTFSQIRGGRGCAWIRASSGSARALTLSQSRGGLWVPVSFGLSELWVCLWGIAWVRAERARARALTFSQIRGGICCFYRCTVVAQLLLSCCSVVVLLVLL